MRNTGHLEDSVFRWARTEMKREKVMASSSYAKIAGLQSEIGRVVITRVAGSELEYKRMLNTYRKDMTMTVNNIRREQIKMRRTMVKYIKKMREAKKETLRRQREEEAREVKRRSLEAAQLGIRFDVSSTSMTPADDSQGGSGGTVSPSMVECTEGECSVTRDQSECEDTTCAEEMLVNGESCLVSEKKKKPDIVGFSKDKPFGPILPMINEDMEKEEEEAKAGNIPEHETHEPETAENATGTKYSHLEKTIPDDELSVYSNGKKRKSKKDVSFSDIIKLRYASNTKQLFNMVHILARKHGITDVEEKISDPRDNVVLRGSTDDSFRLQAATLYPMKYGYNALEASPQSPPTPSPQPSQRVSRSVSTTTDPLSSRMSSETSKKDLVADQRRSSSVSMENLATTSDIQPVRMRKISEPPLRRKDSSLTLLVEKVAKVKLEQAERLGEADHVIKAYVSSKPSSSQSTKSLPPLTRMRPNAEDKTVSWTQAFGLLRAIHSLDNVAS